MLADPFEDFEAGFFGHVDVQEDEGRKRVARAVGEAPFASKVINGLLAVGHGVKRVGRAGRLEGAFKKEDIVFFVFRVEDAGAGFVD